MHISWKAEALVLTILTSLRVSPCEPLSASFQTHLFPLVHHSFLPSSTTLQLQNLLHMPLLTSATRRLCISLPSRRLPGLWVPCMGVCLHIWLLEMPPESHTMAGFLHPQYHRWNDHSRPTSCSQLQSNAWTSPWWPTHTPSQAATYYT